MNTTTDMDHENNNNSNDDNNNNKISLSLDALVQPTSTDHQHLCYVRCSFCNTVLAVGIPYKRLLDTVTVKCGHCGNLSFLSTRPPLQGQCLDFQPNTTTNTTINLSPDHHHHHLQQDHEKHAGLCGMDHYMRKAAGQSSSSSSSSSSTLSEPLSPRPPFVVKPPEKKHRLPSAYNRFMKEEIQRIKSANPEIPHREAFSAAAKNWARYIPNSPTAAISRSNINN